jgi:DASH complex subunit ASK1
MSRQSTAPRNLSLTEELEKLEQSITLTLQGRRIPCFFDSDETRCPNQQADYVPEIDHNFSKAHRIVTTGILPVVEKYGEHSRAVWEASKVWPQPERAPLSSFPYILTTN